MFYSWPYLVFELHFITFISLVQWGTQGKKMIFPPWENNDEIVLEIKCYYHCYVGKLVAEPELWDLSSVIFPLEFGIHQEVKF